MEGPSKMLLGLEAIRGVAELGLGMLLSIPLQFISPRGDGHPVIVIPGLGGSDDSTMFLRNYLDRIGYNTYTWGQGRNLGPRRGMENLLNNLMNHVAEVSQDAGGKQISLIGWSLGGIYSREIAKVCPNLVRQVITLGTPFRFIDEGTNAARAYELLSRDTSHRNPEILRKLGEPPPVPFTSIYSKTDGVVHWQCSIEESGPLSQNIEIPGASHLGLGFNPVSLFVIADRLTQTKSNWSPYRTR